MAETQAGLNIVLNKTTVANLQSVMEQNTTVKIRVLELAIKISQMRYVYIIDILLLGCCTRFSCTLKVMLDAGKNNDTPITSSPS